MSDESAPAREAQLAWEERHGRLAGLAAIGSSLLALASVVLQAAAVGAPDTDRETLVLFAENQTEFFIGLGLQVVSYTLLTGALLYLLRATRHRRPETPGFAAGLIALAPLLLAAGALLNQLELNDIADQFVSSGDRAENRAEELLEDRDKTGSALAQGGTLCFAISFVLVSLNAMRAGLLTRFMGILGLIVGALLVIPILPGTVLQIFWLTALGVLFLGRWPGGRGPAWASGAAIPWPTPTEIRAEREAREGLGGAADEVAQESSEEPTPRPASRKRKRKRQ